MGPGWRFVVACGASGTPAGSSALVTAKLQTLDTVPSLLDEIYSNRDDAVPGDAEPTEYIDGIAR